MATRSHPHPDASASVTIGRGGWLGRTRESLRRDLRNHYLLYLMVVPGIVYFLVFRYGPMYGAIIAFKDYRVLDGISGSQWVGLEHFRNAFQSTYFVNILTNTILISVYKLVFGLPPAILMAILLNEVRVTWFKRSVQTITFLPHFLSWVVISGILMVMLAPSEGLVNKGLGRVDVDPINFLANPDWFRTILVASDIWKDIGWGSIIYLAALANVSNDLYEAAAVDGASRLRRIATVSLPSIVPVIALIALLNIGSLLSAGFEQVFVLYNPAVYSVGDIIDTWVYRQGVQGFQFSVAAAVGLFKGVVGLILVLVANWAAKRVSGNGIW